jgi:hypothetical protein
LGLGKRWIFNRFSKSQNWFSEARQSKFWWLSLSDVIVADMFSGTDSLLSWLELVDVKVFDEEMQPVQALKMKNSGVYDLNNFEADLSQPRKGYQCHWPTTLARLEIKLTMDNPLHPANAHKQRCPRCQSPLNTVVVHGHEQCAVCKSNIFECCSGDTCDTDYNLSVGYKRG